MNENKINQSHIDVLFCGLLAGDGTIAKEYFNDIDQIKHAVKDHYNTNLSSAECAYFWHWRSEQYDASWLSIGGDREIKEWFNKFVNNYYGDNTEEC